MTKKIIIIISFLVVLLCTTSGIYAATIDDYEGVSDTTSIGYDLSIYQIDSAQLPSSTNIKHDFWSFLLLAEDYTNEDKTMNLWVYVYNAYKETKKTFKSNITFDFIYNGTEKSLVSTGKTKISSDGRIQAFQFKSEDIYKTIYLREYILKKITSYEDITIEDGDIETREDIKISCDDLVFKFENSLDKTKVSYDFDNFVLITNQDLVASIVSTSTYFNWDYVKDNPQWFFAKMNNPFKQADDFVVLYYYNFDFPVKYDKVNYVDINYNVIHAAGKDTDSNRPKDNFNNYFKKLYKEYYSNPMDYLNQTDKIAYCSTVTETKRVVPGKYEYEPFNKSMKFPMLSSPGSSNWNEYQDEDIKDRFDYDISALFYHTTPRFDTSATEKFYQIATDIAYGPFINLVLQSDQEFTYAVDTVLDAEVSRVCYEYQGQTYVSKCIDAGDVNDEAPGYKNNPEDPFEWLKNFFDDIGVNGILIFIATFIGIIIAIILIIQLAPGAIGTAIKGFIKFIALIMKWIIKIIFFPITLIIYLAKHKKGDA